MPSVMFNVVHKVGRYECISFGYGCVLALVFECGVLKQLVCLYLLCILPKRVAHSFVNSHGLLVIAWYLVSILVDWPVP